MQSRLNVIVNEVRCSNRRSLFGVRIEEKGRNQWFTDWAFPINEKTAKKEKYGEQVVTGSFQTDESYPGCPFCGSRSFFLCGCGKLACWDGDKNGVKCPWCNNEGRIEGAVTSLKSSSDR